MESFMRAKLELDEGQGGESTPVKEMELKLFMYRNML